MSGSERASKFTWGDNVRVASTGAFEIGPGAYAAVCATKPADTLA